MIQITTTPKGHSIHVESPLGRRAFKNSTAGRAMAWWYAAGVQDGLQGSIVPHEASLFTTTEIRDQMMEEGTITK